MRIIKNTCLFIEASYWWIMYKLTGCWIYKGYYDAVIINII